jgi:hypothetical protein
VRLLVSALALSLLAPAQSWSQPAQPGSIAARLVGTWRLVRFEDVENGQRVYRYGEKPLGIFIYTADGHIAIQIANAANPACAAPLHAVFASNARMKAETKRPDCTPEQMRMLMDGYAAYWGTYSVDAAAGVVIHHVESDLKGGYVGTDQRRPFTLDGDRLVIGDDKAWTRVLERVR